MAEAIISRRESRVRVASIPKPANGQTRKITIPALIGASRCYIVAMGTMYNAGSFDSHFIHAYIFNKKVEDISILTTNGIVDDTSLLTFDATTGTLEMPSGYYFQNAISCFVW